MAERKSTSSKTKTASATTPESTAAAPTRRAGRRPEDALVRRARVEKALAQLRAAQVPFSMGDVAERAGISRATLYRDATLRDLIGSAGEGPESRPVDSKAFDELRAQVANLTTERRKLQAALREAEKRFKEAEARADEFEFKNVEQERARRAGAKLGGASEERIRTEAYAEGFAAGAQKGAQRGGGAVGGLVSVAARLPRPALLAARRTLARALHPDLFAKDPTAALLATELLKQINMLAGGSG